MEYVANFKINHGIYGGLNGISGVSEIELTITADNDETAHKQAIDRAKELADEFLVDNTIGGYTVARLTALKAQDRQVDLNNRKQCWIRESAECLLSGRFFEDYASGRFFEEQPFIPDGKPNSFSLDIIVSTK